MCWRAQVLKSTDTAACIRFAGYYVQYANKRSHDIWTYHAVTFHLLNIYNYVCLISISKSDVLISKWSQMISKTRVLISKWSQMISKTRVLISKWSQMISKTRVLISKWSQMISKTRVLISKWSHPKMISNGSFQKPAFWSWSQMISKTRVLISKWSQTCRFTSNFISLNFLSFCSHSPFISLIFLSFPYISFHFLAFSFHFPWTALHFGFWDHQNAGFWDHLRSFWDHAGFWDHLRSFWDQNAGFWIIWDHFEIKTRVFEIIWDHFEIKTRVFEIIFWLIINEGELMVKVPDEHLHRNTQTSPLTCTACSAEHAAEGRLWATAPAIWPANKPNLKVINQAKVKPHCCPVQSAQMQAASKPLLKHSFWLWLTGFGDDAPNLPVWRLNWFGGHLRVVSPWRWLSNSQQCPTNCQKPLKIEPPDCSTGVCCDSGLWTGFHRTHVVFIGFEFNQQAVSGFKFPLNVPAVISPENELQPR